MKHPFPRTLLASLTLLVLAHALPARADVFVSSEKDNSILQLDADGKVIRSMAVCKRPRHLAWAQDGKQIMAACGDADQIGVVDVATGKQVDAIPTGESPEIFALSPDGKTAYTSIEDDSMLGAYDVASKKKVFTVKTGAEPEGVLATADGKWVFVTSEVAMRSTR